MKVYASIGESPDLPLRGKIREIYASIEESPDLPIMRGNFRESVCFYRRVTRFTTEGKIL